MNSPFAYHRDTCTTSCFILWLCSFFPQRYQNEAVQNPGYQPFVILKQQQHCFHALATGSRSQLPICLQVLVILGTEKVADGLAHPGPRCGTHQQGRNRKGLKNDRKKQPHSLQMKLQNRTTSLLNGIFVFAKPTTFANTW